MTNEEFRMYFKKTYRNGTSSFLSGLMIMFADFFMLLSCIGLSFFIVNLFAPNAINFKSFVLYSYYFPLILVVYYMAGLYPGIMVNPADEVKRISLCSGLCFCGICINVLFQDSSNIITSTISKKIIKDSSDIAIIISFMLAIPFTAILVPGFREVARHLFGKCKWWGVPAVIYCTSDSANTVIERLLTRKALGYKPSVIIDSDATECSMHGETPVFPDSKEILETIKKLKIKVAIMCDYEGEKRPIAAYYRYVITCSKNQDSLSASLQLRDMGGILAFSATHELTRRYNLFFKRLIDLFLLIVSAPLVIPITVLIALLVKITSPGPAFYGHARVGKNGKTIKCWKFRSMYKDSAERLEEILNTDPERAMEWKKDRKFTDDPRVTKFGKFLRKTSLDELPQFFNILLGEMSFIGPRPVTRDEIEQYYGSVEYILSVTPGLSGMWQISGRSDTGYEERINLDTYYIQNWSVWLDIWIIIKTVWVVLNGKGAY